MRLRYLDRPSGLSPSGREGRSWADMANNGRAVVWLDVELYSLSQVEVDWRCKSVIPSANASRDIQACQSLPMSSKAGQLGVPPKRLMVGGRRETRSLSRLPRGKYFTV